MAFVFGVVTFVLGATLVAVCLFAIPGPPTDGGGVKADAPAGHGHGLSGH